MRLTAGGASATGAAPPKEQPRGRDEHIGLRFWVQIDGVEVAGFCECSPITVETETMDYPEGGLNTMVHRLPVRTKVSNITLRRGLDPGQDLFRWFMQTLDGKTERRNVTISVYGPKGSAPVEEWHLRGAYPVKWTGPDLKTETGAVAIESLEFAYESLVNNNLGRAGGPGALKAG
jgi:phage tail-like protein